MGAAAVGLAAQAPRLPPLPCPGGPHARAAPHAAALLRAAPPNRPPASPSCLLLPAGYLVLAIPPGVYALTERLLIKRSRLVLRGAGMGRTVLAVPKSELRGLAHPRRLRLGAWSRALANTCTAGLPARLYGMPPVLASSGRAAAPAPTRLPTPALPSAPACLDAGLTDIYGPSKTEYGGYVNDGGLLWRAARAAQRRLAMHPRCRWPSTLMLGCLQWGAPAPFHRFPAHAAAAAATHPCLPAPASLTRAPAPAPSTLSQAPSSP